MDGRACGDDWLTFAELAAGGALAYCTGTTPDAVTSAAGASAEPGQPVLVRLAGRVRP